MHIDLRLAEMTDAATLAALNAQLIVDEGSRTRLTEVQLTERMRGWLESEYQAVIFELDAHIVGYALWRDDGDSIYLRQFFVQRHLRRQGLGRRCVELLLSGHFAGKRITLEVLTTNSAGLAFWNAIGFTAYAVTLERNQ